MLMCIFLRFLFVWGECGCVHKCLCMSAPGARVIGSCEPLDMDAENSWSSRRSARTCNHGIISTAPLLVFSNLQVDSKIILDSMSQTTATKYKNIYFQILLAIPIKKIYFLHNHKIASRKYSWHWKDRSLKKMILLSFTWILGKLNKSSSLSYNPTFPRVNRKFTILHRVLKHWWILNTDIQTYCFSTIRMPVIKIPHGKKKHI